jgi:hypothetical protein
VVAFEPVDAVLDGLAEPVEVPVEGGRAAVFGKL